MFGNQKLASYFVVVMSFFSLRVSLASKVKKALKEKRVLQVIPGFLVIRAIQD